MLRLLVYVGVFLQISLFAAWQEELRSKISEGKIPIWMTEQIEEDLAPFKEIGISEQDLWETIRNYPTHGFIACKISKNSFSWDCYPASESTDFRVRMFVEAMQQLITTVHLPNIFFLVFIGEAYCEQGAAPVFSWCKHREWSPVTICIPDYEALSGNYSFLQQVQEGMRYYPWGKKLNKALWRGSNAGGWGFDFSPRLKLVQEAVHYPHLIDAKFSGIFQSQSDNLQEKERFLPYVGTSISVKDHLQYKCQILVDGHVSAFSRCYWQLFSGCVMFKNDSPWYQWFYRGMRPYEHYIPYRADASDLASKIGWALEHDSHMYTIASNAVNFANSNLKHSDVMLYVYLLFNKYAALQKQHL